MKKKVEKRETEKGGEGEINSLLAAPVGSLTVWFSAKPQDEYVDGSAAALMEGMTRGAHICSSGSITGSRSISWALFVSPGCVAVASGLLCHRAPACTCLELASSSRPFLTFIYCQISN